MPVHPEKGNALGRAEKAIIYDIVNFLVDQDNVMSITVTERIDSDCLQS
jgi:hypothetical protein